MRHWSEFLPKQNSQIQAQREAIMANHHAVHRMVGQIRHIQKEILKQEQEMDSTWADIFSVEEIERALAQDTIINIICEEDMVVIEPELVSENKD